MKYVAPLIIVEILIIVVILATNAYADSVESPLFCDDPFPPFTRLGAKGTLEGPSVQFLEEVFRRIGARLYIKLYPLERIMQNLRSGKCDGINFVFKNKEREKYLHFTALVFKGSKRCVFSISNREKFPRAKLIDFEWETLDDFSVVNSDGVRKYYNIGSVLNYYHGKQFEMWRKSGKIRVVEVRHQKQSLRMLMAGRVPLILMGANALASALQNMEGNAVKADFHCAAKRFEPLPYYMAISKQSRWLREREGLIGELNRAIAEIQQEGRHTIDFYLQKDIQERDEHR